MICNVHCTSLYWKFLIVTHAIQEDAFIGARESWPPGILSGLEGSCSTVDFH